MTELLEPLLEWATKPGPPNWVFVVAILTAPHLWTKYIKEALRDAYNSRFGDE